jgi:hypothetical protein
LEDFSGRQHIVSQAASVDAGAACLQAVDIAQASFHQRGAERQRWQALVEANSLLGFARHASGDVQAAVVSVDAAQALADHTDQRRQSIANTQDPAIPSALYRIAALRFATVHHDPFLAVLCSAWQMCAARLQLFSSLQRFSPTQGDYDEAAALFERAASAAEAAAAAPSATSPWSLAELKAGAVGGIGQVAIAKKAWECGEESISQVHLLHQ